MAAESNAVLYHLIPIGHVQRIGDAVQVCIGEQFRPGLKQLGHFSHVMVFWWAHRHDNDASRGKLQTRPPYADSMVTGVFATRAEYRPNPIALTTCELLSVDEENGLINLANIDALDGTPVIDLKAYFPVCDRVRNPRIPEWLSDWPEWLPEEGIGL